MKSEGGWDFYRNFTFLWRPTSKWQVISFRLPRIISPSSGKSLWVSESYPFLTDDSLVGLSRKVPGLPLANKKARSSVIPSEHPSLQQESQTKCPKHWGRGESRFTQSVVRKRLLAPTAQTPMAVWSKSSSRLVLPHSFLVCSPPPLG